MVKKERRKFILTGTGNDGFRNFYQIDKEIGFRDEFIRLMTKMGFEEEKIKNRFLVMYESSLESKENIFVEWLVDADEISDMAWNFRNNKFDVDVFFGDKKVFIVIRSNKRRNFVDFFEKESKWKIEKEFDRIRIENDKKLKKRALKEIEKRKGKLIEIDNQRKIIKKLR